ncbi:hypothetical protein IQ268_28160 [Oculatella sp. LEGE 06141]|uniref:hypothetical protein n=1 Tax=Oculatella sp. LEGE 06141 TaxID=1828648 RepID=UPI0019E80280|nr:hypothetical protein [Oculatella sp. LEGE 06141]MBE9182427.1 hypothetical protein [Oculatella sp. LEGE 06141]
MSKIDLPLASKIKSQMTELLESQQFEKAQDIMFGFLRDHREYVGTGRAWEILPLDTPVLKAFIFWLEDNPNI